MRFFGIFPLLCLASAATEGKANDRLIQNLLDTFSGKVTSISNETSKVGQMSLPRNLCLDI